MKKPIVKIDWDTVEPIRVIERRPRKPRAKIDWDTVVPLEPFTEPRVPDRHYDRTRIPPRDGDYRVPAWRKPSDTKRILAGASTRARSQGALYTHGEIKKRLLAGPETLAYGWALVAVAMTSDWSFEQAIDLAARVICDASRQLEARPRA